MWRNQNCDGHAQLLTQDNVPQNKITMKKEHLIQYKNEIAEYETLIFVSVIFSSPCEVGYWASIMCYPTYD